MAQDPKGASGRKEGPSAAEVVKLREKVQLALKVGITDAQDWCADAVHTTRRAWQQWETGEEMRTHRNMHPAFFELAMRKVAELKEAGREQRRARAG